MFFVTICCHNVAKQTFIKLEIIMNRQEHLLIKLIEECAEVQKAAAKALEFGLENKNPDTRLSNAKEIDH